MMISFVSREAYEQDQRADGHGQPGDFKAIEGFSKEYDTNGCQQQDRRHGIYDTIWMSLARFTERRLPNSAFDLS
jgi:hypothetical protein